MNERTFTVTTPQAVARLYNDRRLELPEDRYEWKTLHVPVSSLVDVGRTGTPSWEIIPGHSGMRGPAFSRTERQQMQFSIRLPEDYVPNTSIYTFLDWTPVPESTSVAHKGEIVWVLQVMSFCSGIRAVSITEHGHWRIRDTSFKGEGGQVRRAEFLETLSTGDMGRTYLYKVYRDVNNEEDTLYGEGMILAAGIQYQADTIGAVSRSSKYNQS